MPRQTDSSKSATKKPRKVRQATWAPATEERYSCDIVGCDADFNRRTDKSRHKWVHLPKHLSPTCPFEGPSGRRCSERYWGRSDHMTYHWRTAHPEAGPYPKGIRWPKLRQILRENNITLGETKPRIFAGRTRHSPSSAPSLDQVVDRERTQAGHSLQGTQPHVQLLVDQYYSTPVHGYNYNYSPPVVQQYLQPPFNNTNFPTTTQYQHTPIYNHPVVKGQTQYHAHPETPSSSNGYSPATSQYSEYPTTPTYSVWDDGAHSVVGGQYAPPVNHELEHQGWDLSSTNARARRGNRRDQEWNPSVSDVYQDF